MGNRSVGDHVLYSELSYKIMEVVFEVHNMLGPGFSEKINEEAIVYELELRQIPFERQKAIPVVYKTRQLSSYRIDLIIDKKIILEIKAVASLAEVHKQQLLSYLRASNKRLGILVNLGSERVESVRIVN
jgi:GxxExxY protein